MKFGSTVSAVLSLMMLNACASKEPLRSTASESQPSLNESQKKIVRDTMESFRELFTNFEEVGLARDSGTLYMGLNATDTSDRMRKMLGRCNADVTDETKEPDYLRSGEHEYNYSVGGPKCPVRLTTKQSLMVKEPKPTGGIGYRASGTFSVLAPEFQRLTDLSHAEVSAQAKTIHDTKISSGEGSIRGSFTSVKHGRVSFGGRSRMSIEGGRKWEQTRKGKGFATLDFVFSDFSFNMRVEFEGEHKDGTDYQLHEKNFKYIVNGEALSRDEFFNQYLPQAIRREIDEGWPLTSVADGLKHGHFPWIHYQ